MMKRLLLEVTGILLIGVLMSGCPGSKDPYTASMQASLQVSDAVAQAIPIVTQLQTSGVITAAEAHTVYGYLDSVTTGNGVFRHTAQSLHAEHNSTAAAYLGAAQTFVQGVNSAQALAAIHIVNPQAQQKVMLYLQAISTVLNGIQTVINNNTVKPAPAPTPVAMLNPCYGSECVQMGGN